MTTTPTAPSETPTAGRAALTELAVPDQRGTGDAADPDTLGLARFRDRLSPVAFRTAHLVAVLERALFVGGYARVLAQLRFEQPVPASNPQRLLELMTIHPTAGWSCWDVSVALVELLRRDGITAGVTATLGAEPGAPAEPHALVRVTDEDGSPILADPYFGLGALTPNGYWSGPDQISSVVSQVGRGGAELLRLEHRAYRRRYVYHVLPDTLTSAQLDAMVWQALDYGRLVRHVRGVGGGVLARVIHQEADNRTAELRIWPSDETWRDNGPVRTLTGNWHELVNDLTEVTAPSRASALAALTL